MKKLLLLGAVIIGGLPFVAPQAHATLALKLHQSGYTDFETSVPGDALSILSQSFGTFTSSVVATEFTDPNGLDLSSLNVAAGSTGKTLQVSISADDFTSLSAGIGYLTQLSGHFTTSAGGTFTLTSYVDSSNALFGEGTLLSTVTGGSTVASAVAFATVTPGSPYSITEVLTFTGSTGARLSSDGSMTQVPEPASLALLGMGLFGLGMVRRKKNKA